MVEEYRWWKRMVRTFHWVGSGKVVIYHLLSLAFVLAFAGVTVLASPAEQVHAEGKMTLLPKEKRIVQERETTIQVVLNGFERNEPLVLWHTLPDYTVIPIGTFRADRRGKGVITHVLKSTLYPLGTHYITLRSDKTGQTLVESFELLPAAVVPVPPKAAIAIEPSDPRQGDSILVRGYGYTAKERVAVWLTYPDGKVQPLDHRRAGRQGDWTASMSLGAQDPIGTYFITGKGLGSGRVGVGTFVLEPGKLPAAEGIATIEVTPSVVRQLEAVQISGSGFAPYEVVSLWLTESNGTVWPMRSYEADIDGNFVTARMRIEALLTRGGSPVGTTYFTAYGQISKRIAVAEVLLLAGSEFGN